MHLSIQVASRPKVPVVTMVTEGSQVFCVLKSGDRTRKVSGVVVELLEKEAIVGFLGELLEGVAGSVQRSGIGYLRLAYSALSAARPSSWSAEIGKKAPEGRAARAAWFGGEPVDLESSEAEIPRGSQACQARPRVDEPKGKSQSLAAGLKQLQAVMGEEEEESDSEEEDTEGEGPITSRFKPPGGRGRKSKAEKGTRKPKEKSQQETLMEMILANQATSGQGPDWMPLLLFQMMQDKKEAKRSRRRSRSSSAGGTSSDGSAQGSSAKGMKAVHSLNKMHRRIQERPRRIVKEFEAEIREELGVCPGQSWTVKDFVRRMSWGKYKGLYRATMMDVAVYEYLRNQEPDMAAAQVVQNIKAKMQCVLAQGEWHTAWLLTGLVDPLTKKEFAGTREELAVVSGYVSSLSKLRRQVKEAENLGAAEEAENK